jgi:hypothetical protein
MMNHIFSLLKGGAYHQTQRVTDFVQSVGRGES